MMRDELRVGDSFVIELPGRVTQYSELQGKDYTKEALLELHYTMRAEGPVLTQVDISNWAEVGADVVDGVDWIGA